VPELDLPLRAGDAIYPRAGQFFINGWVSHPGPSCWKTRMTLTQRWRSGGLTFGAEPELVKLLFGASEGEAVSLLGGTTRKRSRILRRIRSFSPGDRLEVQAEPVRPQAGLSGHDSTNLLFRAGGNLGTL